MNNLISHNFSKWNINDIPILLITAAYPGSGKSTLARNLALQNNAINFSIDCFYTFLKMWKVKTDDPLYGKTIKDIEREVSTYDIDNYEMITTCLEYLKTKEVDLYKELCNHTFGDGIKVFEDEHSASQWKTFPTFVVYKYLRTNKLIIIEGGQLLYTLTNDDYIRDNIPLIIVDTSKLRAYYQATKRYVNKEYPNSSNFKKYLMQLYWMFTRLNKESLWNIYDNNEKMYKRLLDKVSFTNNEYNITS